MTDWVRSPPLSLVVQIERSRIRFPRVASSTLRLVDKMSTSFGRGMTIRARDSSRRDEAINNFRANVVCVTIILVELESVKYAMRLGVRFELISQK